MSVRWRPTKSARLWVFEVVYLWLTGHLSASRRTHIHLAGDHVGDQARAVFAQQFDLPPGAGHGGVNGGGLFVEIRGDGGLLGEGRGTLSSHKECP